MIPPRFPQLCAIPLVLLVATHLASADLVTNGGFETGNFSTWTQTPAASGSAFGVGNTGPGSGGSGSRIAYFGATGSLNDAISQTIATTAGSLYTLSFFVNVTGPIGAASNDFRVFFDNTLVFALSDINPGFSTFTFPVLTNSSSTVLRIEGSNARSPTFLDDVSLVPRISALAVPDSGSTLAMLSLASLGLASLRRKVSSLASPRYRAQREAAEIMALTCLLSPLSPSAATHQLRRRSKRRWCVQGVGLAYKIKTTQDLKPNE